jgi:hypothetical protein
LAALVREQRLAVAPTLCDEFGRVTMERKCFRISFNVEGPCSLQVSIIFCFLYYFRLL